MRLAILISLCVLIVTFFVGSLFTYESWRKHRYDRLIVDAAVQYQVPPALLRAIMDARGHFNYYTVTEKGQGLLQVPEVAVRQYRVYREDPEYGRQYVCINKDHRGHGGIRHEGRGVCNICRSPLIPELWHPRENIQIGAWYLAKLKAGIEEATQGNVKDVIPIVVAAYCLTEETVREATDEYQNPRLPLRLRDPVRDILDKYQRYKRKG